MSSKRKSPPTKLQDGVSTIDGVAPLPPTIVGGGSDGGGLTDLDETSSNNLSDLGEEDTATMLNNTSSFYKLSGSSSPSVSGSEVDDVIEEDRSPPSKKQRMLCQDAANNVLVTGALATMPIHVDQVRQENDVKRRNSSECSSPTSDMKSNIHYNNNNHSLLNNNSSSHTLKRSMEDVLKRLSSKMNISTLREENRRPTPPTTPNSSHNS